MRSLHRQNGSCYKRTERLADGTVKIAKKYSIKYRTPDGRQVVEIVSPKKKEAMAALAERLAAMRAGTFATLKEITFGNYLPMWLASRSATLKPSTFRTFAGVLGTLPKGGGRRHHASPLQVFGPFLMEAITPEQIATYLGDLTRAGLKPKTVGNVRVLLSSLFEDAKASGYVGSNPVKHRLVRAARALAPGDTEEMIVPSPQQVSTLLDHLESVDAKLYAFAVLLAATGVRPGEAAAIQTKDLIPAAGQIFIGKNYDARARKIVLPKNGKSRVVDAGPQVFGALNRVGDHRDPEAYLLGEEAPLDWHWWRKRWARLQVEAGCGQWPMYSLRHFCASQMLASGESLAYASRQLGHAKQSMTLNHYSRFIPDTKRERGADRLAAELLGATKKLPIQSETPRNRPDQAEEWAAQVPNKPE